MSDIVENFSGLMETLILDLQELKERVEDLEKRVEWLFKQH